MSSIPKSIDVIMQEGNKHHLTKETIKNRKQAEEKINGKLASDKINPPAWIKANSTLSNEQISRLAEKEFKRIVKEYESTNLLTNLDINSLSVYCDSLQKYIQVTEKLKTESLLVEYTNKNGSTNMVENPLIRVQQKYLDVMFKYGGKLGLSVGDRLKLVQSEIEKPKNKFGDFVR